MSAELGVPASLCRALTRSSWNHRGSCPPVGQGFELEGPTNDKTITSLWSCKMNSHMEQTLGNVTSGKVRGIERKPPNTKGSQEIVFF